MKLFLLLTVASLSAADNNQNQQVNNLPIFQAAHMQQGPVDNRAYTRLSPDERTHIATHIGTDRIAQMARDLGRHGSTVSREIKRNEDWDGAYRAAAAQRIYEERQKRAH